MKKTILIGIILLFLFPGANAGVIDDLMNILAPTRTPVISQPADDFNAFMEQMSELNTPEAIKSLDVEMEDFGVNALKVRVYKMPWQDCEYCGKNFYVVKGVGVIVEYPQWGYDKQDKEVHLTHQQIMRMYPYFSDGKLDILERWQLYAIYKTGGL